MPKRFLLAAFLAACASPAVSMASPLVEATKTCLTDYTSGKDRKLLARWIFLSMSAHPEIASLSAATLEQREETSKAFAALITRLLTVDCATQARAMVAEGGIDSIKPAFQHLGEVAMIELMGQPNVSAAISGFEQYMDTEALGRALHPESEPAN